ncbi:MAG: hypothetical protein JWO98_2571, partial [Frankiales bacterium]|nr:hypothetical protein [Frankiales bacterium]
MTGPYAHAWESYRAAGWTGIIPLPPRKKASPPKGVTGPGGIWPSYADCMSWAEGREGNGNIALRLPPGFLGIDIDSYDGKPGFETFIAACKRYGPPPPSWKSSSREGVSGISFYRVPEGLAWPGEIGPSVETVHTGHRYAVVWPSIHPDTGATYQWTDPDGEPCPPPDVDQLPELPAAWVQGLTGGREQAAPGARNNWDNQQVQAWLISRPRAFEPLCARMVAAVNGARLSLAAGAGSHDTTT